jgi:hypothetical protein
MPLCHTFSKVCFSGTVDWRDIGSHPLVSGSKLITTYHKHFIVA